MNEFNHRGKVIAFFRENHPKKEAINTEIARWIVRTYPDDCKQKMNNSNSQIIIPSQEKRKLTGV